MPPRSLRLEGAAKVQSNRLGLYNLVEGKIVNGKPVWRHAAADFFLAFTSTGWLCQSEEDLGERRGWVDLRDAKCESPDRSATVWHEYDATAKEWVQASALKCVSADLDPPPASVQSG